MSMMPTHIHKIRNHLIKKYLKNFLWLQICKSVTTFFYQKSRFFGYKNKLLAFFSIKAKQLTGYFFTPKNICIANFPYYSSRVKEIVCSQQI